jgi:hypothetical protein
VHAHGTVVLTGNAAEERRVAGGRGGIDVEVLLRGVANDLNEIGRAGCRSCCISCCVKAKDESARMATNSADLVINTLVFISISFCERELNFSQREFLVLYL